MINFTPRDWDLNRSAWFRRPIDEFGRFSNMSRSFPLTVFGMSIRSSENLYQAMRFTRAAEIQQEVLCAKSPMKSKRIAREWDEWTRPDWMQIRVDVMRWALRTKLGQNVSDFGALLKSSGTRPIVEWSKHDSFWGAGPVDAETVHGVNVLGQLLTELREEFIRNEDAVYSIPAPEFPEPLILGIPIGKVIPLDDQPLIHPSDLIAHGLLPGPGIGLIAHACLQRQSAGEFSTLEEGLEIAENLWTAYTHCPNSERA